MVVLDDFRSIAALDYLIDNEGLILPNDADSGLDLLINSYVLENGEVVDLAGRPWNWENVAWNPRAPTMEFDPNASPKPTLEEIKQAYAMVVFRNVPKGRMHYLEENELWVKLATLREHCEKRICVAAVGANSLTHELQVRQRLTESSQADPEDARILTRMLQWRDHNRWRYHEIKTWILSIPVTFDNIPLLVGFDPTSDLLWEAAAWTPPDTAEPFDAYHLVPEYADIAPAAAPPFEMKIAKVSQSGTTHRYALTMTAGAEVSLSTDNPAVTFPVNPVARLRAGTLEFEVEIPRGTGTVNLTATASPYGEEVTVSAQASSAARSRARSLGAMMPSAQNVLLFTPTEVTVPAQFVQAGLLASVSSIELRGAGSGFVACRLAASPGAQEFTDEWEEHGLMHFTAGAHSLTVTGPASPGNVLQDMEAPYFWAVVNSAEVDAFIAAVRGDATAPEVSVQFELP